MCNPALLTVASTAVSTMSQYNAANAQADIANQNANLVQQQIYDVENQKQQQLKDINRKKQQTMGTQRASMAASGMDSGYGSGLSILSDTAYLAQEDKNEAEYNAVKDEWGLGVERKNYKNQAAMAKSSGRNSLFGGMLSATGQYMSNLDTVSSKWKRKNTSSGGWQDAGIYR